MTAAAPLGETALHCLRRRRWVEPPRGGGVTGLMIF
jgi:hypothetical protein